MPLNIVGVGIPTIRETWRRNAATEHVCIS
jgi:hypothetical protein